MSKELWGHLRSQIYFTASLLFVQLYLTTAVKPCTGKAFLERNITLGLTSCCKGHTIAATNSNHPSSPPAGMHAIKQIQIRIPHFSVPLTLFWYICWHLLRMVLNAVILLRKGKSKVLIGDHHTIPVTSSEALGDTWSQKSSLVVDCAPLP